MNSPNSLTRTLNFPLRRTCISPVFRASRPCLSSLPLSIVFPIEDPYDCILTCSSDITKFQQSTDRPICRYARLQGSDTLLLTLDCNVVVLSLWSLVWRISTITGGCISKRSFPKLTMFDCVAANISQAPSFRRFLGNQHWNQSRLVSQFDPYFSCRELVHQNHF